MFTERPNIKKDFKKTLIVLLGILLALLLSWNAGLVTIGDNGVLDSLKALQEVKSSGFGSVTKKSAQDLISYLLKIQ